MTMFNGFLLGLIQGLTEFLPVSSSAHLIILPKVFRFEDPGLAFDLFLHIGTLISVIFYFRKDLLSYIFYVFSVIKTKKVEKGDKTLHEIVLLSISFLITGVLGVFLKDYAENEFRNLLLVAFAMILFSVVMYVVDLYSKKTKSIGSMTYANALFVGLVQSLAFIPGVSRSGSTIIAALLIGLTRDQATRFSFLLSIPVIGASAFIKVLGADFSRFDPIVMLVGFVTSLVSGYFAIKFLSWIAKQKTFLPFVVYRIALAIFVLIFLV